MKVLLEILVSVVLHPIAMILMWINVLGRSDLTTLHKVTWLLVSVLWGFGPIFYVLLGEGKLW